MNYIKEIQVKSRAGAQETHIAVAFPSVDTSNKITVLCGRNRTGKSHILKYVDVSLTNHNKSLAEGRPFGELTTPDEKNVCCHLASPSKPSAPICYIGDAGFVLKNSSTVSLADALDRHFRPERLIKHALRGMLIKAFGGHLNLDLERWHSQKEYQSKIIGSFDAANLYRLHSDEPLLKRLEELFGGRFYFHRHNQNEHFELVLRFNKSYQYKFDSWSSGQKMLFAYTAIIAHSDIGILLLDEPETYLHPEYLTFLLDVIKSRIPQSLIATHHPHLIFSRLCDSVWFMEMGGMELEKSCESVIPFKDRDRVARKPPLPSKSMKLTSDLEKLSASYKIFANFDNNLLRVSEIASSQLDEAVVHSVSTALRASDVASPTGRWNPDTQSDQLGDRFLELFAKGGPSPITILDFGAGKGRSFDELIKRADLPANSRVNWLLWEPHIPLQSLLIEKYAPCSNVTVVSDIKQLAPRSVDLVLVSNVIHELNPKDAAELIGDVARVLRDNGWFLLFELFPLVSAEKYAVPYRENELSEILRLGGWVVATGSVGIKSSTISAYWLRCTNPGEVKNVKDLEAIFTDQWQRILKIRCQDYQGMISLSNPKAVVETLGTLTTIASICSYNMSEWPLSQTK